MTDAEPPSGTSGPPDPTHITDRAELGRALTGLRAAVGLSVRQLAAAAAIPSATVGGYVTAKHLPPVSQHQQFRAMLAALGVPDADHEHWLAAVARVRTRPVRRVDPSLGPPYRGLQPFDRADAGLFFGRDVLVASILRRVRSVTTVPPRTADPLPRLLFLVGASGSGKSSLLRAGLVPAVAAGALTGGRPAPVAVVTPGEDPVRRWREAVAPTGGDVPAMVVLDQFEEVFTRSGTSARQQLWEQMGALDPRTVVVAGLRADFWAAALAESALAPALEHRQVLVTPMTSEELREAVTAPALACGVIPDPEFVEQAMLDILRGHGGRRPALPLLSHALLASWERHTGARLTREDYVAVGGVPGAVQRTAELTYAEIAEADRPMVRRVFLRLTTLDDDAVPTRRTSPRAELDALDGDTPGAAARVVEAFVASRLLTADREVAEISHEALLEAWPRLVQWLAEDRHGQREHRAITRAAAEWGAAGQEPAALLAGTRLAAAAEWAQDPDHDADLAPAERTFLAASRDRARDLARAARRRRLANRGLTAALGVLLVVVAVALVVADHARTQARSDQRDAAVQRDLAASRAAALQSTLVGATDSGLAQRIALAAYTISPSVAARSALLDQTTDGVIDRLVATAGPTAAVLRADGRLLARSDAADGSVLLYALDPGRPVRQVGVVAPVRLVRPAPGDVQVYALAFDAAGDTLAIGSGDGTVRTVDVSDPSRPGTPHGLGAALGGTVQSLAFARDGAVLFATAVRPALRAYDLTTSPPATVDVTGIPAGVTGFSADISPDGTLLALGGDDGVLRVVRLAADAGVVAQREVALSGETLDTLMFSPDGRTLAVGDKAATLRLVDVATLTSRTVTQSGASGWVSVVAWSADGGRLVAGATDGRARVFAADGTPLGVVSVGAGVTAAQFVDDGGVRLMLAGTDGVVRFAAAVTTLPVDGPAFTLAWNAGDDDLAVAWTGDRGSGAVWNAAGALPNRPEFDVGQPGGFVADGTVAMSGDGRLLALGSGTGDVLLCRDVDRGQSNARCSVLTGPTRLVETVAFNPDATILAAGSDDGQLHLWDLRDPVTPVRLTSLPARGYAQYAAFSPDGTQVAVASTSGRVYRWAVGAAGRTTELPALAGFEGYAWSLTWSADSRLLAAGGADDTVRVWDVGDADSPRQVLGPLVGPENYVNALAFTPDGRRLAAAGGDGSVWIWELSDTSAQVVATLRHANVGTKTYAIAYSSDGSRLVAAGIETHLTFWTADADAFRARLCATGHAALTAQEWQQYVPEAEPRDVCP